MSKNNSALSKRTRKVQHSVFPTQHWLNYHEYKETCSFWWDSHACILELTHCGLVMPYCNIDLGQHWRHQTITWTNTDQYWFRCSVEITWEHFHKKCSWITCVLTLDFKNCHHISLEPMTFLSHHWFRFGLLPFQCIAVFTMKMANLSLWYFSATHDDKFATVTIYHCS